MHAKPCIFQAGSSIFTLPPGLAKLSSITLVACKNGTEQLQLTDLSVWGRQQIVSSYVIITINRMVLLFWSDCFPFRSPPPLTYSNRMQSPPAATLTRGATTVQTLLTRAKTLTANPRTQGCRLPAHRWRCGRRRGGGDRRRATRWRSRWTCARASCGSRSTARC